MQFTRFSNPDDFMPLTEMGDPGAKNSDNVRSNYKDINSDFLKNDEDNNSKDKSGAAILVNRYNPNRAVTEDNKNGIKYWHETTREAVKLYMDNMDPHTLEVISVMNEEQQNSLLVNLTNKLYTMIISKVDEIDYGEIPQTRGDITRLKNYDNLRECIDVLKKIFEQYKEDLEPVRVIERGIDNIENHKDIFTAGFAGKIEFVMSTYKTMTLAVINATSFMIAVCIEYIKNPKADGLKVVLNKTGIVKVKDSLVYESLNDFNEACKKGEVEHALRPMINAHARGFAVTAALGLKSILVVGSVLLALIPIIRNLVYFFYAGRTRVSTYFDLQAKLLEMNAQELEDNPNIKTEDDKQAVIRRQLSIAKTFHSIADTIAIEDRSNEVQATKEIKNDARKYRIDDVSTPSTPSDSGSSGGDSGGSLF